MPFLRNPVLCARKTSPNKSAVKGIAVIRAVNPDNPGAFLFALAYFFLFNNAFAFPAQTRIAVDNAINNNLIINVTPMLFNQIDAGMSYDGVLNTIGQSASYCDSGEYRCSAENGSISKSCLTSHFINSNKAWVCHWDGKSSRSYAYSRLEIWFTGNYVNRVTAVTPDGLAYKRNADNTVYLEKNGVRSNL